MNMVNKQGWCQIPVKIFICQLGQIAFKSIKKLHQGGGINKGGIYIQGRIEHQALSCPARQKLSRDHCECLEKKSIVFVIIDAPQQSLLQHRTKSCQQTSIIVTRLKIKTGCGFQGNSKQKIYYIFIQGAVYILKIQRGV